MDHFGARVAAAQMRLGAAFAKWKWLDDKYPNIDTNFISSAKDELEERYDEFRYAVSKHYPHQYETDYYKRQADMDEMS